MKLKILSHVIVTLHLRFKILTLLTYILTPWCRVLLEKLTGLQLVKKFPAFYGTRRFITALTSVRHGFKNTFWEPVASRCSETLRITGLDASSVGEVEWYVIPTTSLLPLFETKWNYKTLGPSLHRPRYKTCTQYNVIRLCCLKIATQNTRTSVENLSPYGFHSTAGKSRRKLRFDWFSLDVRQNQYPYFNHLFLLNSITSHSLRQPAPQYHQTRGNLRP